MFTGACNPPCAEREAAMKAGRFAFAKSLDAWIFVDDPIRSPTTSALKRYIEGKLDHLPERMPVTYTFTCPFCGGAMREEREAA